MTAGAIGSGRGLPGAGGAFAVFRLSRFNFSQLIGLILTVLVFALFSGTHASARGQRLVIEVGKGLQLQGTEEAETLFVADPDVADLSASPGEAHFLYGKRAARRPLSASMFREILCFNTMWSSFITLRRCSAWSRSASRAPT